MKALLVAVNAKYIHSNLGIYSLKAYAGIRGLGDLVELGEYTINHKPDDILKDIYKRKPDMIGFSCYIWNIEYIRKLVRDLPKILPLADIWLGGPEVSYCQEELLRAEPGITGIMSGEGEETFARLLESYHSLYQMDRAQGILNYRSALRRIWQAIPGLCYRSEDETLAIQPPGPLMDLDLIPFPYEGLDNFRHRIIYYESSRGCPFSCSYCLSSIDKTVRLRSLELVKRELDVFLKAGVMQVKFIDRTFNCNKTHAMEIWQYLLDHDRGITNFHFEVSADLLGKEELDLMRQMRPGLIQLEIGVQSINPDTIREIHRTMNLPRLKLAVGTVKQFGNIHQHLDLIAGLPYEDFSSFCRSFNFVYAMKPEQLQLGFLKVLSGSRMRQMSEEYEMMYSSLPPYEVLSTRWLTYGDVLRLKAVEEMVECYYNSGQFVYSMGKLETRFRSAYDMYEALAQYYEANGLSELQHNRMERYEILFRFITALLKGKDFQNTGAGEKKFQNCLSKKSMEQDPAAELDAYRDCLLHDLYLRENCKRRPSFARDLSCCREQVRKFYQQEAKQPRYLTGYAGYESRQLSHMTHIEMMGDGRCLLYDYQNRSPLSHNAAVWDISGEMRKINHGKAGNKGSAG